MTRAHEETSKLENTLSSVWLLYLEVKLQQATNLRLTHFGVKTLQNW